MRSVPDHVKQQKRSYNASGRRERAQRTGERVMDVAYARFTAHGFSATTLAGIAEEAGVSVDLVHKSFGGKAGLVRAICERGLLGAGSIPAEHRSDLLQETESDLRRILAGIGELAAEVAPRVAPLQLLLAEAAHTNPEMAQVRAELDEARLIRMTQNAGRLHRRGFLRAGMSVDRAGEIMWLFSSPELYRLMVQERGWRPDQFSEFVAESLAAALLPSGADY